MKVIIFADDPDLAVEVVQKQGHAVVGHTSDSTHLLSMLLQYTPHLVLAEKTQQSMRDVARLQALFTKTRFVLLGYERNTTWTSSIRKALRLGPVATPWSPGTPEQRTVVFDLRWYQYFSSEKIKAPEVAGDIKADPDAQALRLHWMLQSARQVAQRAEKYRKATKAVAGYDRAEVVYCLTHNSFKAPAYAAQMLGKNLGYLAHFVPGIDFQGLPVPCDEPENLKFVHYQTPPESLYGLFALSILGCNAELARHLYRVFYWTFQGQTNADLSDHTLLAIGAVQATEEIVGAHARAIKWMLDPAISTQIELPRARALQRAIQTFADWWCLRRIITNKQLLASFLKEFHESPPTPPPKSLAVPTYAAFIEALNASSQTNPKQQNP